MIKRVIITAGGTGGHIFPALSVAKRLRENNIDVLWVGTKDGLEAKIIPKNNITIKYIDIIGLRKKGLVRLLSMPFILIKSIFQALKIIKDYDPNLVFGMGGFVAAPCGFAAFLLRKRLIIHEQNSIAGLTNKVLSLFSYKVLTGFPKVLNLNVKYKYVGNPVRSEIEALEAKKIFKKDRINLLVFGGSRGAASFNEIVPEALEELPSEKKPNIWHQAGKNNSEKVKSLYQDARVDDFIDDMAYAYKWADLVICRAGASTVAELATVGIASILIPFPYAVDDHQTFNARFLSGRNAAILLPPSDFTKENIKRILMELIKDPEKLIEMADMARDLRKVDVVDEILKEFPL